MFVNDCLLQPDFLTASVEDLCPGAFFKEYYEKVGSCPCSHFDLPQNFLKQKSLRRSKWLGGPHLNKPLLVIAFTLATNSAECTETVYCAHCKLTYKALFTPVANGAVVRVVALKLMGSRFDPSGVK